MTRLALLRTTLPALAGLSLAACAVPEREVPDVERTAVTRQAVLGGEASPEADDFVVQLALRQTVASTSAWSARCSGVLVADKLVVTTKHCLEDKAAADIGVYVGARARAAVVAQSPPAARVQRVAADPGVDLAVLVLSTPLTGKPLASLRLSGAAVAKEKLAIVGFGGAGADRLRREGVAVSKAGTTSFDVPESACEDDQGGPAIAGADGVVGIASLVAQCTGGSSATYVPVKAAAATIQQVFADIGAQPKLAPAGKAAATGGGADESDTALADEDAESEEESVTDGDDPELATARSSGCAVARDPGARDGGLLGLAVAVGVALAARRRASQFAAK